MAKKKSKPKSQIQFRLPDDASTKLEDFAEKHELPLNEAARRLVVLSLNHLGPEYYPPANYLTECMPGNPAFGQACAYLAFRLEQEEEKRKKTKTRRLTIPERLDLAQQVIGEFGGSEELLKEEQKQYIHEHRLH